MSWEEELEGDWLPEETELQKWWCHGVQVMVSSDDVISILHESQPASYFGLNPPWCWWCNSILLPTAPVYKINHVVSCEMILGSVRLLCRGWNIFTFSPVHPWTLCNLMDVIRQLRSNTPTTSVSRLQCVSPTLMSSDKWRGRHVVDNPERDSKPLCGTDLSCPRDVCSSVVFWSEQLNHYVQKFGDDAVCEDLVSITQQTSDGTSSCSDVMVHQSAHVFTSITLCMGAWLLCCFGLLKLIPPHPSPPRPPPTHPAPSSSSHVYLMCSSWSPAVLHL